MFCSWSLLVVVLVLQLTDALKTEVVCPRPIWPLWELGWPEVLLSIHPPMASLSGSIWGTGWAVAPSCPGQGGHQFGNLVPQIHSTLHMVCSHGRPSPYLIMGFLILTLSLVGSNNELGISGSRVAIEVSYGITDMLADPVEEMIFEVLLDL